MNEIYPIKEMCEIKSNPDRLSIFKQNKNKVKKQDIAIRYQ